MRTTSYPMAHRAKHCLRALVAQNGRPLVEVAYQGLFYGSLPEGQREKYFRRIRDSCSGDHVLNLLLSSLPRNTTEREQLEEALSLCGSTSLLYRYLIERSPSSPVMTSKLLHSFILLRLLEFEDLKKCGWQYTTKYLTERSEQAFNLLVKYSGIGADQEVGLIYVFTTGGDIVMAVKLLESGSVCSKVGKNMLVSFVKEQQEKN